MHSDNVLLVFLKNVICRDRYLLRQIFGFVTCILLLYSTAMLQIGLNESTCTARFSLSVSQVLLSCQP
jgi:hypothetical protein